MKKFVFISCLFLFLPLRAFAQGKHQISKGSMVHVNRLDNCKGCERELASALKKKKVPLIVVKDRAQARYEITGVVTVLKTYTTFTAAGLGTSVESEKISIQIVDREKSSVVYTDTVSDKVGKVMKECAEHIMNDALAP